MGDEEGSILGGLGQMAEGVVDTASDLGSAAYDAAASTYHGAAAAGDAFFGDHEGTQQHMDAADSYADDVRQDLSDAAQHSGIDQIDPSDLTM
jgi:hypothetical protein